MGPSGGASRAQDVGPVRYFSISIINPHSPMDLEDTELIEHVLDVIDSEMASPKKPKVLLFDVGGVCVSDPATQHRTLN